MLEFRGYFWEVFNSYETALRRHDIYGRKTGLKMNNVEKDSQGFDDISQVFATPRQFPKKQLCEIAGSGMEEEKKELRSKPPPSLRSKSPKQVNRTLVGSVKVSDHLGIREHSAMSEDSDASVSGSQKSNDGESGNNSKRCGIISGRRGNNTKENDNDLFERAGGESSSSNNQNGIDGEQEAPANKARDRKGTPERVQKRSQSDNEKASEHEEETETPANSRSKRKESATPNTEIHRNVSTRSADGKSRIEHSPQEDNNCESESEDIQSSNENCNKSMKEKGSIPKSQSPTSVNNNNQAKNSVQLHSDTSETENEDRPLNNEEKKYLPTEEANKKAMRGTRSCALMHSCKVLGRDNKEMFATVVALPPTELRAIDEGDNPVAAIKTLHSHSFSAGFLHLPPKSKKPVEIALNTEIFYVSECTTNGLKVQIHETQFTLSHGDTFTIPARTHFQLVSNSNEIIKLCFVLLKQDRIILPQ